MERLELVDGQLNLLKNEREEANFENINHICRLTYTRGSKIVVVSLRKIGVSLVEIFETY